MHLSITEWRIIQKVINYITKHVASTTLEQGILVFCRPFSKLNNNFFIYVCYFNPIFLSKQPNRFKTLFEASLVQHPQFSHLFSYKQPTHTVLNGVVSDQTLPQRLNITTSLLIVLICRRKLKPAFVSVQLLPFFNIFHSCSTCSPLWSIQVFLLWFFFFSSHWKSLKQSCHGIIFL